MKLAARPALGGEMGARNAAGHETRKPLRAVQAAI